MLCASKLFKGKPLALVEIGCSAGLNLLWDQYSYDYGEGGRYRGESSSVLICSEARGMPLTRLWDSIPDIQYRIGLDLDVVDHLSVDSVAWLHALIYPEHHRRRDMLDAALRYRSSKELDLRSCNGFSAIEDVINEIPLGCIPVVYHTNVANQVSGSVFDAFNRQLAAIGASRDLVHLYRSRSPQLFMDLLWEGSCRRHSLAQTCLYGSWLEWCPRQESPAQGRG